MDQLLSMFFSLLTNFLGVLNSVQFVTGVTIFGIIVSWFFITIVIRRFTG